MPPFVLTVLKILFLLLLYFFVWRAIRTIGADLYGRRAAREPRRGDQKTRQTRRPRGGVPGKVVVLGGKGGKGSTYRLNGTMRLGRDGSCEIKLDDTYASQEHARIAERGGAWVVEDLGSTNGTYLNRQKITVPTQLAPGDRIRIGNTELEVRK